MCNCKETSGFNQKLSEAKKLTAETGETYVVYAKDVVGHGKFLFVRKEADLNDDLGICCYYLPNGKEVEYTSRGAAKPAKKPTKPAKKPTEIEVKEAEEVKPEPTDENETSEA